TRRSIIIQVALDRPSTTGLTSLSLTSHWSHTAHRSSNHIECSRGGAADDAGGSLGPQGDILFLHPPPSVHVSWDSPAIVADCHFSKAPGVISFRRKAVTTTQCWLTPPFSNLNRPHC